MLPLAAPPFPDSAESLARALREGLAHHSLPAREVTASGAWPHLDSLRLDFTGLALTRTQRAPLAKDDGESRVAVADFSLLAAPMRFENTPIEVSLRATQAAFTFAQSAAGETLLTLADATHGELALEIRREALETMLHSFATEAAREHGVDIKKTRLELTTRGPRELAFRADVTAKMFIASATVSLSGDISVDEQLEARLGNLRFSGDGMIANAAGGFIRPHLEKLDGRRFPLMAFSLGGIKLRDLQLQGGESLRLTAQFGSDSTPAVIS